MRRGHPTGGGSAPHAVAMSSTGMFSIPSKSRACASIIFIIAVVGIVVIVPPMKAKPYLATETGGVEEVQRLIQLNQRQQFLDDTAEETSSSSTLKKKSIDLTVYIVFHKTLIRSHYAGINWNEVALPTQHQNPHAGVTDAAGPPVALSTQSVVTALSTPGGANRTTIVFVATNRNIKKRYDPDLVRGRLIKEWELPGFDTRIGSSMNEFGAMNSIFSSMLTQHAGNIANVVGRGASAHLVAADADGDGVQEWIAVFQYDMHIDSKLLRGIRRRIVQKTTTVSQWHQQRGLRAVVGGPTTALHCCIFYGVSYPTRFLLHNALGKKLLLDYNTFFGSQFTLNDLPPISILDAFVVPSIVFNHFAPFLESVMLRVLRNPQAYPEQPNRGGGGGGSGGFLSSESGGAQQAGAAAKGASAAVSSHVHALDVMEAALALALGLETLFVQVQLPLRHKSWDN